MKSRHDRGVCVGVHWGLWPKTCAKVFNNEEETKPNTEYAIGVTVDFGSVCSLLGGSAEIHNETSPSFFFEKKMKMSPSFFPRVNIHN